MVKRAFSKPDEFSSEKRLAALLGMSAPRFLAEYWQKKPLLVRSAFRNFQDPLAPDELAGLACEPEVEARLIEHKQGWHNGVQVSYGPFEESRFATLGKRNWTLLVQEVNRWVPDAALLLEPFSFLPNVRVDDVMVSFAAKGGGVGPHVDSYDVFLLQGKGKRRWRFGTKKERKPDFVEGLDLRILRDFRPSVDKVLEPGDMLYLPPGFAHEGTAETACMTYSIGFRAPRTRELWTSFAHWSAAQASDSAWLTDPKLSAKADPGEVPLALRKRVRALMRSLDTSDAAIDRWYAAYATQLKPDHPLPEPEHAPSAKEIHAGLIAGQSVARSEELRFAWMAERGAKEITWYVGGTELRVPHASAALAKLVSKKRRFKGAELRAVAETKEAKALLQKLFAMGALVWDRVVVP
jgi:50S ribosomal protein L16 3-hydroxylase